MTQPRRIPALAVNCAVCNVLCDGRIHFDAQTCAACAAFFRRTVAERQQYICKNSLDCKIEQGIQGRTTCRSCRYEKCLAVGMLPKKVRYIWKSSRGDEQTDLVTLPTTLQISDTDMRLNEIAYVYLVQKQLRQQQYNFASNALNPPISTLGRFLKVNECELHFEHNFIKSCAAKTNFIDTDRMLLHNNFKLVLRIAEQSFVIAFQDGRRLNRFIGVDGSFIPVTLDGFTKFMAEFPSSVNSPQFLARIIMPSINYQMNVVASAIENMKPDATESAALLNLILFDPDIPGLSSVAMKIAANRRQQILNDLYEYYTCSGKNFAVRLGNLLLLLAPLKECTRQRQEAFQMFSLARAPVLPSLMPKKETS